MASPRMVRDRPDGRAVMRILLCAANVSEGRDLETIEALSDTLRPRAGVLLFDRSWDADHGRSIYSYLGSPDAVLEATKALASEAFRRIDMREHRGQHPRIGALDVVPFVPVRGVSMEEAVEVARQFGRFVGELGIPVYYYEEAATRPERRPLPALRAGGYEGLEEKLRRPEWAPDEGPARFHARSGAVVTGAREPLLAFNVNLRTDELDLAVRIARAVRDRDGGLRHVRAIPVALPEKGMVQVSMNLLRPAETPPGRVLEAVRTEAARRGVSVAGTEIVGPVPVGILVEAAREGLQAHDLDERQIIELALLEELIGNG